MKDLLASLTRKPGKAKPAPPEPVAIPKGPAALLLNSDLHRGSVLAPFPEGLLLEHGLPIGQNPVQAWIDAKWREWHDWAGKLAQGRRVIRIFNGDLCEGRHHRQAELITNNLALQRRAAKQAIEDVRQEGDLLFLVRGTWAHAGAAGEDEETIAEMLGCTPEAGTGHYSYFLLPLSINGTRIIAVHTIGATRSPVSEATALVTQMAKTARDSGRWGTPLPDILVFAHRHQFCAVHLPARRQGQYCCTLPSWVGKTEHGYSFDPLSPPQIGGVVILIDADGTWQACSRFWALPTPSFLEV